MRVVLGLVMLLGVVAIATPAFADFEDIGALEARVIGALDTDIGKPGGPVAPIDRRLKLAACPTPATIDPPALGAVALRCPALGWRIRVPLVRGGNASTPAGAPSTGYAAKTDPVVRRGDPVQLVAESGVLSVSTEAVAQEDGAPGERIRVKTDDRAAIVIAEVVEIGKVRLPSFN